MGASNSYASDFFKQVSTPANIASWHLIVAGSTYDAVEKTSDTIDMLNYGSLQLQVPYVAALASGETADITIKIQESDDDSSYDSAVTLVNASVISTGESGDSTNKGVVTQEIDFTGRKRYAQFLITFDLNASGTDTASWTATAIKAGANTLPV